MGDGERPSSASGPLARAPSAGLVVGAITSVQFGASLATTMFQQLGPAGTVFLRLGSASLMLLALWRPRLRGRTRAELLLAVVFGLVLAAMNLSFYEALDRIPLGIAVAIEFLGPLSVAVAGSRRRLDLLWVALALAGILALTRGSVHGLDQLGVALALLAGASVGRLHRAQRAPRAGLRGLDRVDARALRRHARGRADRHLAGGGHLLEPSSLALGAAVGLLSCAIPYSFEVEALRRIAAPAFGVLMSLEPAVAALAGFIVLGQQLGARALLGIALVMAASIGAAREAAEPPLTG